MRIPWTVADMPSLEGERYFITGANSGIGYQAAVELARHGAVVVMACRDTARGEEALRRLKQEATGPRSAAGRAELVELDLASLESVKRVAEAEVERERPLRGLINNAGVYAPKQRKLTKDGFELQFGTNVLGHYALTCRVMPALERGRSAVVEDAPRVVTIASIAHKRGRIDFADLNKERRYVPLEAYAQSKLANLMFAFELELRLREGKLGAISVAAHPGVANTRLFQGDEFPAVERVIRKASGWAIGVLLGTDADGALPTLYAATADGAVGGGYYGPQGFKEARGGDVGDAQVAPQARDRETQRKLWEVCEEMTGVGLG